MSTSPVEYKIGDNQDCFLACPPGSLEISRPQPATIVQSPAAVLTYQWLLVCTFIRNSDNSRTTNLESPLPAKRPEAWMKSQSLTSSRVSLGRFVEQLNLTVQDAVSIRTLHCLRSHKLSPDDIENLAYTANCSCKIFGNYNRFAWIQYVFWLAFVAFRFA